MKYQVQKTYEVDIPDGKERFVKLMEYIAEKGYMSEEDMFELMRELRAEAYAQFPHKLQEDLRHKKCDELAREWACRNLVELFYIGDAEGVVTEIDEEVTLL